MFVLGLETSSQVMALGVADEKKVLGELNLNIGLTHGQQLLPAIVQLLKLVKLQPQQLTGIGVAIGPGSFTGLRIGVATAKAFAQGLSIHICGVPTFQVLASNFVGSEGLICPLFDARRGEVYAAVYRYRNQLVELLPAQAVPIDQLVFELKRLNQPILFCGDGAATFESDLLQRLPNLARIAPAEVRQSRGGTVARIALQKILNGQADDLFELKPQYLRKSEAELAFACKGRIGRRKK